MSYLPSCTAVFLSKHSVDNPGRQHVSVQLTCKEECGLGIQFYVCSALAGWGEGCRGSLHLIKMKYYTLDLFRPKGCFQVMIRTSNENKKINGDIFISRITLSKEKLIGDQIDLFLPK